MTPHLCLAPVVSFSLLLAFVMTGGAGVYIVLGLLSGKLEGDCVCVICLKAGEEMR